MRIRNILSSVALLLTATTGIVSCDSHIEEQDTSMKVGHILCTDGMTLPYEQVQQENKTPIGIVFYVDNESGDKLDGGSGLAVYLWDVAEKAFADSLGTQGTSADFDAYDGNSNTYALLNSKTGSPISEAVFSLWDNGRSCYVPSVAEMRLMYSQRSIINKYAELCGGTKMPSSDTDVFYWTSTEVKGQESAKAWVYSLSSGAVQEAPKTQAFKVRPIITLYK